MASDIINDLAVACTNLTDALAAVHTEEEQRVIVHTHIQLLCLTPQQIADFQTGELYSLFDTD